MHAHFWLHLFLHLHLLVLLGFGLCCCSIMLHKLCPLQWTSVLTWQKARSWPEPPAWPYTASKQAWTWKESTDSGTSALSGNEGLGAICWRRNANITMQRIWPRRTSMRETSQVFKWHVSAQKHLPTLTPNFRAFPALNPCLPLPLDLATKRLRAQGIYHSHSHPPPQPLHETPRNSMNNTRCMMRVRLKLSRILLFASWGFPHEAEWCKQVAQHKEHLQPWTSNCSKQLRGGGLPPARISHLSSWSRSPEGLFKIWGGECLNSFCACDTVHSWVLHRRLHGLWRAWGPIPLLKHRTIWADRRWALRAEAKFLSTTRALRAEAKFLSTTRAWAARLRLLATSDDWGVREWGDILISSLALSWPAWRALTVNCPTPMCMRCKVAASHDWIKGCMSQDVCAKHGSQSALTRFPLKLERTIENGQLQAFTAVPATLTRRWCESSTSDWSWSKSQNREILLILHRFKIDQTDLTLVLTANLLI